jgi:hypothetical protein
MFLGFATKSVPLCWFLQIAILVMVAYTMGVLPAICSNIYPAGVRISGFNFAYNTGIMTFGGLVRTLFALERTALFEIEQSMVAQYDDSALLAFRQLTHHYTNAISRAAGCAATTH